MSTPVILPRLFEHCWHESFLWRDGFPAAIAEELALRATAPFDMAAQRLGAVLRTADNPATQARAFDALHLLTVAQVRFAARLTARVLPHLPQWTDAPEEALQEALLAVGLRSLPEVERIAVEEIGDDLIREIRTLLAEAGHAQVGVTRYRG